MKSPRILGLVAVCLSLGAGRHEECEWTQWGRDAAHGGGVCLDAQPAKRVLAEVTFDPFAAQEQRDDPTQRGDLLAHYQVPILSRDDVFMLTKTGSWIPCDPPGSGAPDCGVNAWNSQIWNEKRFQWEHGRLVERWSFASDYKPVPARMVGGWEPMFQPALAEEGLYVPGAGGTVFLLDRHSGHVRRRLNPFGGAIDPNTYVAGGITADKRGNVYWNVVKLNPAGPFRGDAQSWLVRADDDGRIKTVSYANLIPGAPAPTDQCLTNFFNDPNVQFPLPPPPNPDGSPALPPAIQCGSQRPGINVTPAIGRDGTIFTVTRAHFQQFYGYVVALKPDLSLKWAASMRGHLHDGCGVLVPYVDDTGFACREGAGFGVDPFTGQLPAGGVTDQSSSSPVALPDGGVVYGSISGFNESRGHTFKFDAHGQFAGSFDFGWDLTPGVWQHDGTYSLVVKNNHYGTNGPYYLTQLNSDLIPEWSYKNTTTEHCARQPDGSIACTDTGENPDGFEWCINAPAIDEDGTVYGTSEDGNFYAIRQGGHLKEKVFLNIALGAAYTPLSIDPQGRIFALNNGGFSVLGR